MFFKILMWPKIIHVVKSASNENTFRSVKLMWPIFAPGDDCGWKYFSSTCRNLRISSDWGSGKRRVEGSPVI